MDDQAFLRTILDRPDDDNPRLVYADWLQENGDPDRAEFIRAQIGLDRAADDDPDRAELTGRAEALLARKGRGWLRPLQELVVSAEFGFTRGFVEDARLSSAQFLVHGERLFALTPLRRLTLSDMGPGLGMMPHSPLLARLEGLDLGGCWQGDAVVTALGASPHLGGLASLGLSRIGLGPAGAEALARFTGLNGLRSLTLSSNSGIGDAAARALAGSAFLPGLSEIGLGSAGLTDEGLRVLLGRLGRGQLTRLDLSYSNLGVAGARRLAESPALTGLRRLSLASCRLLK